VRVSFFLLCLPGVCCIALSRRADGAWGETPKLYNDTKQRATLPRKPTTINRSAASGVVPLHEMRAEVDRLSAHCLQHGNCYGSLSVRLCACWERGRGVLLLLGWPIQCALFLEACSHGALHTSPPLHINTHTQDEVKAAAARLLPPSAAELASRRGLHVAVTYPDAAGAAPARQELVGSFTSKQDLVDALGASTYIPFYAGPKLTTRYELWLAGESRHRSPVLCE
jgi:hypothetical protein